MSWFVVNGVLFVVYKGGQATELADSEPALDYKTHPMIFDDVLHLKNSWLKGVLQMHACKAGALVVRTRA